MEHKDVIEAIAYCALLVGIGGLLFAIVAAAINLF